MLPTRRSKTSISCTVSKLVFTHAMNQVAFDNFDWLQEAMWQ
jgi:hypothetical protein